MKIDFKQNRGVVLIVTILLMTMILLLSMFILSFSLSEDKISKSQSLGAKTYYLAEAGIQEMVWKLKNDSTYKNNFETDEDWTTSFTRTEPFGSGSGSYTVSVVNSSLAHGIITSTGTIDIGNGKTTQRIIKTFVYRAMGQSGIGNNAGYADGNIEVSFSVVNFHNGSAHSNNNFDAKGLSTVNVDDDLNIANQYIKSSLSTVNVGGTLYAANHPPAAAAVEMPAIDFDSSDANSLLNTADAVYTSSQFDSLMASNQNLVLNNDITYVTGDVELKGNQTITVNGLLVVGRDLIVGRSFCRGLLSRCGNSSLIINHTAGKKSGVLVKRKIYLELFTGTININGVVYANDQLNILSFPFGFNFDVTGGLISRKLSVISVWEPLNITHDNTILVDTLGASDFSPVITVEHWEEEY